MALTEKGVVREVNEVLSGYRIKREQIQLDLTDRSAYVARFVATILQQKPESPVKRGVQIGIHMLDTLSAYAARHTNTSVLPMYRLATHAKSREIGTFRPLIPDHLDRTPQRLSFAPEVVVETLANHGLWLASQDASRRKDIPGLLEKRLEASAKNPHAHLQVAVATALDAAACVAASVCSFERDNGITERGSNVAGYAIFGYSFGEYERLSNVVDTASIGRL